MVKHTHFATTRHCKSAANRFKRRRVVSDRDLRSTITEINAAATLESTFAMCAGH